MANKIVEFHRDFSKITLDDKNTGRQEFWKECMKTLDEIALVGLKFNIEVPEGVGGFYRPGVFDTICFPESCTTFDEKKNTVKFKSDYDFAIFIHEWSHFCHFVRDKGMYMHPAHYGEISVRNPQKSVDLIRCDEYEAGYRSVVFETAYHMFENPLTVKIVNFVNLWNYDRSVADKKVVTKFDKKRKALLDGKDEEKLSMKEAMDLSLNLFSKITDKYSAWADMAHPVTWAKEPKKPKK